MKSPLSRLTTLYRNRLIPFWLLIVFSIPSVAQESHPRIYISDPQKPAFLKRLQTSEIARTKVEQMQSDLAPYITRHQTNPEWIISRLQMYWKTKYTDIYVNGMDFSHGEGMAPVPTVRFSGSRDWATDYLVPDIKDVQPYMDDARGLYLQNEVKEGQPWEWVKPAETGHVIERINEKILDLARDAAFLYWLSDEHKYAVFASDIFMKYITGMYYRNPPRTFENHRNAKLMGLQTFEVIHERIVEPVTVCFDFLYPYLQKTGQDLDMIYAVLKKWVDQEIKFGVPDNNWNLMQARYITYLALALEQDDQYPDGQGQGYYLDQMLHRNSEKQKALVDVLRNFDPETGIWPETSGYSTGVSEDILEIICLIDRVKNNRLLETYPLVEKAVLATFQYLFPSGFTVAFGDAKHRNLRFNALELLISQYRKYDQPDKEALITGQLKKFIETGVYYRADVHSLFQLFMYVDTLKEVSAASGITDLVTPVFYAPNVSWLIQRNGMQADNALVVSTNASLGNHSHTNGINIELFAKEMVVVPDCAAGVSYWSKDHREYYSRFPAHNTVVVDGQSDYWNMRSNQPFTLQSCYPQPGKVRSFPGPFTFSDVSFIEPSSNALQRRLTGTIRTSENSGYFVDIFRSARKDNLDKKHEYLFHSQGQPVVLSNKQGSFIQMVPTEELSSSKGDLVGYDYFKEKRMVAFEDDFVAHFAMPGPNAQTLKINFWMRGYPDRKIFTLMAPPSRAISTKSAPESLYKQPLPTLVVRQSGEAKTRPFVSVIEVFSKEEGQSIRSVEYFEPEKVNPTFVGMVVKSKTGQVDYIFNDTKSEVENKSGSQRFKGDYGVISYQGDQLHSIFLGNGTLLQNDGWRIVSKEIDNAVLIQIMGDQLRISARKSFQITLPIPAGSKSSTILEGVGESKGKFFTGKFTSIDGVSYGMFDLPAMDDIYLKLNSN